MSDLYFNLTLPFSVGAKAGSNVSKNSQQDNLDMSLRELPFCLYIDEQHLLPRLYLTPEIESAIGEAYGNASMISSPLGTSSLSSKRMNEILSVLKSAANNNFINKKFIEIGSGMGHLLSAVRELGASVTGFEIGPQGVESQEEFNLKIINDYFDKKYLTEKVDCIYSSGCLEHIIDLDGFIKNSIESLNPKGLFFHSVPNSLIHFEEGKVEGLTHEHINYFTPENAVRFLQNIGLNNCEAVLSAAGNEIFLWGYKHDHAEELLIDKQDNFIREKNNLISYEKSLVNNLKRRISKLQNIVNVDQKTIGFYGGGAEICYLAKIEKSARFFDGDESKWGQKWFSGLSVIENPERLASIPVSDLVICVEHYAAEILNSLKIKKLLNNDIKIHLLSEL